MKQILKNAANENEVKQHQQNAKLSQEKDDNDLRNLLNTDQGRRFLYRLIDKCGFFKTSFTGSSQTFFLEGQRNIGLFLVSEINRVDPEGFAKVLKQRG